jgi:rod shape-determining protein MreD
VLVIHDAILRNLRLDAVRPDLLLGLVVVAGVVTGPEQGAIFGFVAGIVADLFLPTPFGMSALVWCLLGYAIGSLQATILPQGRLSLPVTALVGSAAGEVLFALVGSVLGLPAMIGPRLAVIAAIVAGVNALVSWPLAKGVRWSVARHPVERAFAP